ncbi:MAG: biotin--[acetyl-CoA-carboxylase] ligase [Candidatus Heimdallarchaeota archaeon]|nr:biotin--[acetyl-CoA-carboxylase] ligase [Candidatus Heimdallarchaeota archaeon]
MDYQLERKILTFKEVESTQKIARHFLHQGKAVHGLVIQAASQTGGIGQKNRSWYSPLGGLWLSVILLKELPLSYFSGFSIRIGLSIIAELEKKLPLNFKLKWPNDLILAGKKVGGILTDLHSKGDFLQHLVLGIGINVNNEISSFPLEIRNQAISIKDLLEKKPVSLIEIRENVLNAIDIVLESFQKQPIRNLASLWNRRSLTFNQPVNFLFNNKIFRGIEKGITPIGELKLKIDDKIKSFSTGRIISHG